jgi:hypothetical protein
MERKMGFGTGWLKSAETGATGRHSQPAGWEELEKRLALES